MTLFLVPSFAFVMSEFFQVYTHTPWDNLETNELTKIRVLSLKSIFKKFPVIEKEFFDDLTSNIKKNPHYSWIESIKRIIGPKNEDYDIKNWLFIWGFDIENRTYQFLCQKTEEQQSSSKAVLVALAPPELGKLFSEFKKDAMHRIFSLINTPSKIKFLMVLAPKGSSIAQEYQAYSVDQKISEQMQYIKNFGQKPNLKGEWFPHYKPICPICNNFMMELKDYDVGFGQLICPSCGYKAVKK